MEKSSVYTTQKGFAHIFIIVAVLAVLAIAGYYFISKNGLDYMKKGADSSREEMMQDEKMMDTTDEVSESTKTDVIESELDATTVGSVDSDINELEVDASSL